LGEKRPWKKNTVKRGKERRAGGSVRELKTICRGEEGAGIGWKGKGSGGIETKGCTHGRGKTEKQNPDETREVQRWSGLEKDPFIYGKKKKKLSQNKETGHNKIAPSIKEKK